jgi:site-specific recombinase XerD
MRLQDALDRYVVQLEADGRSEHTIGQYRRHVALLARWLAQEGRSDDLELLDHETLARFLTSADARTSRRGGAKRATTLNCLRSSLRAFGSYCHEAGWVRANPCRLIRRVRCAGPSPRGLSDQDRDRLLAALIVAQGPEARRDHLLFDLMLSTGIRLSAALALTDADVDLQRGELVVQRAKGNRVERVILGADIRDHLVGYLAERRAGPLFPSIAGHAMSRRHAVRRLAHWMKVAGCQGTASPHTLRHDFATRLYRRTGDVLLVQAALGHRAIASTVVYARADEGRLRAALG